MQQVLLTSLRCCGVRALLMEGRLKFESQPVCQQASAVPILFVCLFKRRLRFVANAALVVVQGGVCSNIPELMHLRLGAGVRWGLPGGAV